ncbi:hypothetical protein K503DRAFT_787231 [Rhizopogon vinicolor AM-OR11-026]|uniref:DUF6533 domain-containing protein n=1 Tax=Rhizopogon vinicolor AM-OR11-026 TaxID=1314800 RepID=A0A1B7MIF5_9AGAM|nr:hypothetical protein K503DRAFT_787231 [Rhizopogon vinicolor AM-OR11-026]
MAQGLPITVSNLTPGLYDVVTHLDEEIDYVTKSGSPSVKVIFILCRYLPFIIGILRVPSKTSRFLRKEDSLSYSTSVDVVGAGINDDKHLYVRSTTGGSNLTSTTGLCVAQMACAEYITSIQRYNASLTAGLFGITMCRVLMQYRATSGKLLNLLMRHNIMYFAAGVALNLLNIVGILLDPVQTKWHTDVIEIVQILFQALLATRMQLHLWNINRRTVESTALTMSMEDFQVMRSNSTVH